MPCLSGKFAPQVGPVIQVGVAPAGSTTPVAPPQNAVRYSALLDTGATHTCISPTVAAAVGLQPSGKTLMFSATQQKVAVNTYVVDLILPFPHFAFGLPGLQVVEFAAGGPNQVELLIGRDIICRGSLTIGPGDHFTFCL